MKNNIVLKNLVNSMIPLVDYKNFENIKIKIGALLKTCYDLDI